MRILFIGDIFGRPGRIIVKERLSGLVREHAIDLIIANGENSAAGFGITPALAEDFSNSASTLSLPEITFGTSGRSWIISNRPMATNTVRREDCCVPPIIRWECRAGGFMKDGRAKSVMR